MSSMPALGIVGGLSVVLGVSAWLLLGRLIVSKMLDRRLHSSPDVERPEDRGFATERFWIPVDEGHRLHAWIIRPDGEGPFPCIVMIHGFHSHKDCLWSFPDEPGYQGSMMDQGAARTLAFGGPRAQSFMERARLSPASDRFFQAALRWFITVGHSN